MRVVVLPFAGSSFDKMETHVVPPHHEVTWCYAFCVMRLYLLRTKPTFEYTTDFTIQYACFRLHFSAPIAFTRLQTNKLFEWKHHDVLINVI